MKLISWSTKLPENEEPTIIIEPKKIEILLAYRSVFKAYKHSLVKDTLYGVFFYAKSR